MIRIELYLHFNEEGARAGEEIMRVTQKVADLLIEEGYGNEAGETPEDTKLTSIVIVKDGKPTDWEKSGGQKNTMAVMFPTADPAFLEIAEGVIPE